MIAFPFNGRPAFIEPVHDYAERVERLRNGREQTLVTALMFGEIAGSAVDFDEVREWLPDDVLGVLGLATGTEIGAPWVEIRDESGAPVRRFHVSLGLPRFSTGHQAIREGIHTGIGHLLACGFTSMDRRRSALRTAVDNIVRAGSFDTGTVEEKLMYLFRALDGLCQDFSLYDATTLSAVLDPSRGAAVRTIFETAATALSRLTAEAKDNCQNCEADVLHRLARQLRPPEQIAAGFTTRYSDSFEGFIYTMPTSCELSRQWSNVAREARPLSRHCRSSELLRLSGRPGGHPSGRKHHVSFARYSDPDRSHDASLRWYVPADRREVAG